MTTIIKNIKTLLLSISMLLCFNQTNAQNNTNTWKMQLAFGINMPNETAQSEGFATKNVNFPTINLGVQYMFAQKVGAKLDFGYNRASNETDSPEFKFNYSRVNAQLVYDFSSDLMFLLPPEFAVVTHLGPGMSFATPLGSYSENKHTFLNGMLGVEMHLGLSETLSVYTDVSYILALNSEDKYDPVIDGFSFNGNMLTVTLGVSVSLSGCRYCN